MATRKAERQRARRELIIRTARVWSRLTKEINKELNEVADNWIKDFCDKEFPEKFTKILKRKLREALAYGYWLQWLYLYELRGKKYRGKINLAEGDSVKENVQNFMSSGEWNEVIPKDAVNWINGYVPKLSGNFSSDVLERTRDVVKNSLQEGATLKEREKELQKVLDVSKSRIESIARTEVTRAHNLGSLTAMKANEDVIGVEFSAVLDNRTTPMCSERHGLRMRLDDPRIPENTPPLHVQCRSMLLALTIYDYPDGLLTSHEFDEGISPGEQRPEDIEEVQKIVEPHKEPTQTGAFNGALNDKNDPDRKKRDTHAELFYEELRNSKPEPIIKKLSENAGIPLRAAQKVFEHVFIDEHDLDEGFMRFPSDYDMSQSFQRLLSGKNIQEHDIILLKHERLEYELMNRYGIKNYDIAHNLTNKKHNYGRALLNWIKRKND